MSRCDERLKARAKDKIYIRVSGLVFTWDLFSFLFPFFANMLRESDRVNFSASAPERAGEGEMPTFDHVVSCVSSLSLSCC